MTECSCDLCVSSCSVTPGWFLPSQIPSLLKHFKAKNVKELMMKHDIAIDWFESSPNVYLLSPNIVGNEGNPKYPSWPEGTCVFLKDKKCTIHKVKPYECAKCHHDDSHQKGQNTRKKIVAAWKKSKIDLRKELDRKDV